MNRFRRLVGIAAVAALAMGTAVATAQPASAEPTSRIAWKPCEDAEGEVHCATIKVPLDYSDPRGEKIEIGLAKRPATKPGKRIGALLVNPGGPGGSGVKLIKGRAVGSQRLQERFDLIGFDPRGINTSTQIKCSEADLAAVAEVGLPSTKKKFTKLAKLNNELADGCRELTGPLFDHSDNLHTVQDIDRIRKAIGEDELNFLGYSYGTLMGQQYAERYPDKIRAMVLDGNMDHSLETTYDFVSTETGAVERNFKKFAKWCDNAPKCALYGEGTKKVYGQLREAAKDRELVDPESGEKIDFFRFSEEYGFGVNQPANWPDLAAALKALREGRAAAAVTAAAPDRAVNYVFQSMFCSDWGVELKNFDEWQRMIGRLAEDHPNVQWSRYNGNLTDCVGGAVDYSNPREKLDMDEDTPPLVMIGNLGDFATVYKWSKAAAKQSGATLITYEGYGHTIYGDGYACVDDPVEKYLIDLERPAKGISCDALESPDDAGAAADRAADTAGPYART